MIQIKTFDDITSNLQDEVNKFLLEKKDAIISVTPLYNTINGGIQYVVVYNKETKARKHTSPLLQEFDAEIHSEAMKENAIGFLEWYSMNRYYQLASSLMHSKIGDKKIYTENQLYDIYKESKFASFN